MPFLCSFHISFTLRVLVGSAGMQWLKWNSCGMGQWGTHGVDWKYYNCIFVYAFAGEEKGNNENKEWNPDWYTWRKTAAQNYYAKLILSACRWHLWWKDNFNCVFSRLTRDFGRKEIDEVGCEKNMLVLCTTSDAKVCPEEPNFSEVENHSATDRSPFRCVKL